MKIYVACTPEWNINPEICSWRKSTLVRRYEEFYHKSQSLLEKEGWQFMEADLLIN